MNPACYKYENNKKIKSWYKIYGLYLWPAEINYLGALIINPFDNECGLTALTRNNKSLVQEAVDLLAFITHVPLFIETNDKKLNYLENDLYELIRFKDEFSYFADDIPDEVNITVRVKYPLALSLYNTALKQPEALAKCVFLFRVIDYYYALSGFSINKENIENFIERSFDLASKHHFKKVWQSNDKGHKKEYISCLKVKIKKILKSKTLDNPKFKLGTWIFYVGRGGSAHANKRGNIIMHERLRDYREVEKVCICLELLVRYLIERSNPEILNINI